jgi:hypothetical protein
MFSETGLRRGMRAVGKSDQSPKMTMPTPTTIDSERDTNRKLTNPSFVAEAWWSPAAIGANLRPAPHAAASNPASQFA